MISKRLLSVILIIAMILTMIILPVTLASAESSEIVSSESNKDAYGLTSKIQDGNILHAFNWKAKEITEHAQEIAEAGYSTVQITPMQTTKQTINGATFATDWWSFYQPTKFSIGNQLGTEVEIKDMCTALHSYGVKVIADVVTNHSMGIVAKSKKESEDIKKQLDSQFFSYYRRQPSSSQDNFDASDVSRERQVTGTLNKELPDFNTGNKNYQNLIINKILVPYLNCGVDGFRFDAAKHIETPDDGAFASDYWPTVTKAIKDKKSDAYIYGELLATGGKFNITSYTKYINVTDYAYGATVRSALSSKNASSLINYGYSGTNKNQNVLWVESHDNFCDKTSTNLNKNQQIVGWAAIAARKDAPALYLVRPVHEALDDVGYIKYDDYMGYTGAATTWKDKSVVAVNKFKNAFVGENETVTANGSLLFIQRGKKGMVISNLNANSTSVNQSCTMENGTYVDQVTGNKFTVSGGKISGTIGTSGVAVIYNVTKQVPKLTVKLGNTEIKPDTLTPDVENRYTTETATINISGVNTKSLSIKVNGLNEKSFSSSSTKFTINKSVSYGKSVQFVVNATSNDGITISNKYTVHRKNPNEAKAVYFDNNTANWFRADTSAALSGTDVVYCIPKKGSGSNDCIQSFPGTKMTLVSGRLFKYPGTIPSNTTYVKFSEGPIPATSTHIGHTYQQCGGYCGRTLPQTVVLYGSAVTPANRQNGGYKLDGAMICKDLKWYDYGDYPVISCSSSDITFDNEPTKPTETTEPTIPTTPTKPTAGDTLYLGDTDLNTKIEVSDVTKIQQGLANIVTLNSDQRKCADVDSNLKVEILDATYLQQYLAQMSVKFPIGKPISDQPTTEPTTEPTTQPSTVKVTVNLNGCFAGADDISLFEVGGIDYPGTSMTKSGSYYTALVDPNSCFQYKVVATYGENYIESGAYDVSSSTNTLDGYTIKCTEGWSNAYVHIWTLDGSGTGTVWPGVKMQGSSGNFTLKIPKDNSPYAKYKFNSGLGGSESGEYSFPWYVGDNMTIYCDFGKSVSPANAHYWVDGGGSGTTWPGAIMEKVSGSIYKIDVPLEYNKIIFNVNGNEQTDDLDIPGDGYIYNKNSNQWSKY